MESMNGITTMFRIQNATSVDQEEIPGQRLDHNAHHVALCLFFCNRLLLAQPGIPSVFQLPLAEYGRLMYHRLMPLSLRRTDLML